MDHSEHDQDPADDESQQNIAQQEASVASSLPTLVYYEKMYAKNFEGNDQKALFVFRRYESHEKLRRLQNELVCVKNAQAGMSMCDRIIGKKRKGKYQSYERWASLMLLWLAGPQR